MGDGRGGDDARGGAALILAGDGAPEERFDAAAVVLEDATSAAVDAHAALDRLSRVGSSLNPAIGAPVLSLRGSDLLRLAVELRAAGTTAGAVASLRHAAAEVLDDLERALAAATDGDANAIDEAVAAARSGVPAVERWNETLPTLPVWTSAVTALLDSLADVASAQRSGDEERLAGALAGYHDAAETAERADRGLAIALGDAAASIGSGAPVALAEALAEVSAARTSVASVVLTDPREGVEP